LLVGIPLTGDAVSVGQWLGLALTTLGLLFAIGAIKLSRSAFSKDDRK
jgi:hypothetical protein